jgi:hypothetical protein
MEPVSFEVIVCAANKLAEDIIITERNNAATKERIQPFFILSPSS